MRPQTPKKRLLLLTGALLALAPFARTNAQNKGNLVLPDINIVGQRAFEFVLMGEKAFSLQQVQLPAHRAPRDKQPAGSDLLRDRSPKRPMPRKEWPMGNGLWLAQAEGGSFSRLHLGAQAGREHGQGGMALTQADHAQSSGHMAHSASRNETLQALMAVALPDEGAIALRIGVEDGEQELWGTRTRPQERRVQFRGWKTRITASLPVPKIGSTTFGGHFDADRIEDQRASVSAREGIFGVHGAWDTQMNTTRLRLSAAYTGVSLDQDTADNASRLFGIESGAERAFGAMSLEGGIRYYYADDPSKTAEHMFYPVASLTFAPSPRFKMAISFDPSVAAPSMWERYRKNPFLQLNATPIQGIPNIPNRILEKPVALFLDGSARLREDLSTAIRAGYERTEQFPIWTDADTNGTWEIAPNREIR
ncbi:MAG: hypothetical protein V1800_12665, partial [Candidatus Latescibacterota bacterium]